VYAYEPDTGDGTAPVADEDHGGGGMDAVDDDDDDWAGDAV
jgi:hypothetical protein